MNEETNKYWIHSYNCIRRFYPENHILIIDDDSDYQYISEKKLYKTTLQQSEYPRRGELLPYYYYLKNKFADTAVILHDSTFITKYIDFTFSKYKFLWHFNHNWDQIDDETTMIQIFNNNNLLHFYKKKNLWRGCFGGMTIISHEYLESVNAKYELRLLLNLVLTRYNRCSFERVIACILQKEHRNVSLFGDIMGYVPFGSVTFTNKDLYKHLPIIKIWTGR